MPSGKWVKNFPVVFDGCTTNKTTEVYQGQVNPHFPQVPTHRQSLIPCSCQMHWLLPLQSSYFNGFQFIIMSLQCLQCSDATGAGQIFRKFAQKTVETTKVGKYFTPFADGYGLNVISKLALLGQRVEVSVFLGSANVICLRCSPTVQASSSRAVTNYGYAFQYVKICSFLRLRPCGCQHASSICTGDTCQLTHR
jgi:hypothetical protein